VHKGCTRRWTRGTQGSTQGASAAAGSATRRRGTASKARSKRRRRRPSIGSASVRCTLRTGRAGSVWVCVFVCFKCVVRCPRWPFVCLCVCLCVRLLVCLCVRLLVCLCVRLLLAACCPELVVGLVREHCAAVAAPAFRYIDGITMLDKALLIYTSGTTGLPKVTQLLNALSTRAGCTVAPRYPARHGIPHGMASHAAPAVPSSPDGTASAPIRCSARSLARASAGAAPRRPGHVAADRRMPRSHSRRRCRTIFALRRGGSHVLSFRGF
jgi:hypothetical protein